MKQVKKFVIVGGGTAGWLTALIARQTFPEHEIELVESESIGILGAGEGSTPHLLGAFSYVGIELSDLIQNTSSTVKNGILFDGWSEGRKPYLHGFEIYNGSFQKINLNHNISNFEWTSAPILPYLAEYQGVEDADIDILTYSSINNKSLFRRKQNPTMSLSNNGMEDFFTEGVYAVHFDAQSLANYMSKVAQSRRVTRTEGKVQDIVTGPDGNICCVKLEDGREVSGDFFFDCSGFARLIIGKHFDSEWVSFKDNLPAKRAMPFFMKPDRDIPPYTLAKAMERGWIWQIPLQHRYGCGYVYDPDQISDEDVKREIDSFVGEDVEIPRIFNFEPGYYRDVWVKNCLALGLSNGFVEPLEATSIMQLLFALQSFFSQRHKVFSNDQVFRQNYNRQIEQDHKDIASFIYLHYLTNKTNNDFWSNFTEHYKMPDDLVPTVERIERGLLNMRDNTGIFDIISFTTVARGNGLLTRKNVEEIYNDGIADLNLDGVIPQLSEQMKEYSSLLVPHRDLLSHFGANFEQE
jgi:tryptophan halogenase